jgi:hypothetical protein
MKTRSCLFLLTILFLVFSALPAFSDGWVYGQFNTWYEKSDGSRLSNGKYTIEGEDYIFDIEGNRVSNQWTILTDGERYYSLSDGKVAKNQWINDTFYVDDTGAMVRDRWYNGNYFDIDGFLSAPQTSPVEQSLPGNSAFIETEADITGLLSVPQTSPVELPLPEKSAFFETEAENFDDGYGILASDEGGGCLGYIENGDYAVYKGLNFDEGAYTFIANATALHDGGLIELHIDSLNGPVIGTCRVTGTESWEAWRDFSCDIEPISGIHDLYLVFRGNTGYLFNINFFQFTGPYARVTKSAYRMFPAGRFNDCSGIFGENNGANIGYIENGDWVMYKEIDFEEGAGSAVVRASALHDGGTIEFRLDGVNGTLIGTCPVTHTGGWGYYYDFVCGISNAKGIHDLYLVFRGGSGYLFNIQLFWFEK